MRILILIAITILAVGCGGKDEYTTATKPELEGVNEKELEYRDESDYEIIYLKDSDVPYTGKVFRLHENGQLTDKGNYKDGKFDGLWIEWYENGKKKMESNYKDGKIIGLQVIWHENGQKGYEVTYKDDEIVEGSEKFWNSKGEPVDSEEEAGLE